MINNLFNRLTTGVFLIGLGIAFLFHQLGFIQLDIGYIIRMYWPLILVFAGLKGFFFNKRTGGHRWGGHQIWNIILVSVGLYFLNRNLALFPLINLANLIRYMVPALFILTGLILLFRSNKTDKEQTKTSPQPFIQDQPEKQLDALLLPEQKPKEPIPVHTYKENTENRSSFIGDLTINLEYKELHSMNISNFIGDTELNFTNSEIFPGETKLIISAFIGDIRIIIPDDETLEISVSASSFIGDIHTFDRKEGGLFNSVVITPPSYLNYEKRLNISASLFIGDIQIIRATGSTT